MARKKKYTKKYSKFKKTLKPSYINSILDEGDFDAGKFFPSFPHDKPKIRNADEAFGYNRVKMIARARSLIRNDSLAAAALRTTRCSIIGNRPKLSLRPDYTSMGFDIQRDAKEIAEIRKWARKFEKMFNTLAYSPDNVFDASGRMNFEDLLKVAYNHQYTDGEGLAKLEWFENDPILKTKVHMIDPARMVTPDDKKNDPACKDGVAIDQFGRPEKYFLYDPKFGKKLRSNTVQDKNIVEINARTNFGRPIMLHWFRPDFAEQTHGVTDYSSGIFLLKQISTYINNENDRMALQASIAYQVKSNEDYDTIAQVMGQIGLTSRDGQKIKEDNYKKYIEAVQNGKQDHYKQIKERIGNDKGSRVVFLLANESVEAIQGHNHTDTFGTYLKANNKRFTGGVGADYASTNSDFSDTSYAASRLSMSLMYEHFIQQKDNLMNAFAFKIVKAIAEEWVDSGEMPLPAGLKNFHVVAPFLLNARFISSGKPVIDPLKEAKAKETNIDNKFTTYQSLYAEAGLDWEDELEQMHQEKQIASEFGIELYAPKGAQRKSEIGDENV